MEKNLQNTSKIVENFGLIKFYKNRIPYNFRSSRLKIEALQKLPWNRTTLFRFRFSKASNVIDFKINIYILL